MLLLGPVLLAVCRTTAITLDVFGFKGYPWPVLVFVIFAALIYGESARWSEEFAAARATLISVPSAKPAVEKCLATALAHEKAEGEDVLQQQAREQYSLCLPGLGPNTGRFFSRSGGLGVITQDILGPGAFLDVLHKTPASAGDRAGLASMTAEAFYNSGDFEHAAQAADAALKLNPDDKAAFAIYKLAHGRKKSDIREADSKPAAQSGAPIARALSTKMSQLPLSLKLKAQPPPDPNSQVPVAPPVIQSDFLGAQLQRPLLTKSDQNPVSRKYLSPLLRSGHGPIRFARNGQGPWGTYDTRTGGIELNLDSINQDLRQYNAHQASIGRPQVAPIGLNTTLSRAQIDHLTTRFMPLILHEIGGHATNGKDLRALLKVDHSPVGFDTEVFAWRLHCLYIEVEQRKDPSYLSDPAPWASFQRSAMHQWRASRSGNNPAGFANYLRSFYSYSNLPYTRAANDDFKRIARDLETVQNSCRHQFDHQKCPRALSTLSQTLDPVTARNYLLNIHYLHANPGDHVTRARVVNQLIHAAIVFYRLDPKGVEIATKYYAAKESEVDRLQRKAAPRNFLERITP